MGVLYSLSIKNIFYDKMDLRLFYFRVTILCLLLRSKKLYLEIIPSRSSKSPIPEAKASKLEGLWKWKISTQWKISKTDKNFHIIRTKRLPKGKQTFLY